MAHIKSPMTHKYTLNLLLITLILAYVLYNNLFFAVVLSNSMRPTAEKGDMILMQNYNITPKVGDIVMFRHDKIGTDEIITHRVHGIYGSGIQTKGDAAPVDPWVTPQRNIISKAFIVGNEPVVLKSVGYYFLDESPTTTYSGEFGFMKTILMKAKEIGLLIFAVCIILFVLLSVNDTIKQKKLRNRRLN